MGLLVTSDQTHNSDADGGGKSMLKGEFNSHKCSAVVRCLTLRFDIHQGDLLMLAGATLYGFSKP